MGTKNYRKNLFKLKGFTLVELLIVISIIAVLVVVVIVYLRSQVLKGNDARRKADINRIKIAVEEYEKDNNCYPQYITCGIHTDQPVYPYLNDVPCDPVTHASYVYENDGSALCPKWYRIYAKIENLADVSITPGIGINGSLNYSDSSPNAPSLFQSTTTPTPAPSSGGGSATPTPPSGFYGCKTGVCVPIAWDNTRPGPECDPNYQNRTCYGQCGPQGNECISWK